MHFLSFDKTILKKTSKSVNNVIKAAPRIQNNNRNNIQNGRAFS